jgi:4-hydroxythreonine-4-phosphate dehydrogenase
MKHRIAISVGDINGIGPELILKSVQAYHSDPSIQFVIYAPESVIRFYNEMYGMNIKFHVVTNDDLIPDAGATIVDNANIAVTPRPGEISKIAGEVALDSIKQAVESVQKGYTSSLTTSPISKESIQLAGSSHPGHTEYLSELTGNSKFTMMLVSEAIRVALVTSHIPLRKVSESITKNIISEKISIVNQSLLNDFGIQNPKIAVLGLNPHAGDGGVLGMEEVEVISPVIRELNKAGINCDGPYAADGWFGMGKYHEFDAVIAMYHDQGLAPFKALTFGKGVNYSAGLPIIRTSPDHGTAFEISGKYLANNDSMLEAIKLAIILGQKRKGNI